MKSRNLSTLGVRVTEFQNPFATSVSSGMSFQETFTVGNNVTTGDRKTYNPHSFTKVQRKALRGLFYQRGNISSGHAAMTSRGLHVDSSFFADGISPTPIDSTLLTIAYNSALSKLNDEIRGNADLSIDFIQRRQTFAMTKNVLLLARYARDLRRNLRISPGKAIGSVWLEYTYGWKPLVSTIYEVFDNIMRPERQFIVAKARGKSFLRSTSSQALIPASVSKFTDSKVRCEISVKLKPNNSRVSALASYTSLNPASMLWEAMPYSFVVDWVYNLGGYLRNLETALVYCNQFVDGYVTYGEKTESIWTQKWSGTYAGSNRIYDYSGGWTRTMKDRQKLYSYPFPRFPVLNPELGTGRLLNAAALLSQFLTGKAR